jgi:hypothetical protein
MTNLMNITRSKGDPKILKAGQSSATGLDQLAKSLAWFGIGLGSLELVAAKRIARFLGVEGAGSEAIIRAFGAREIAAGVMTLSTEKKAGLWARVAGDGLDTVALLSALQNSRGQRNNVKLALLTVLGATALDLYAAGKMTTRSARTGSMKNFSDRTGYPRGIERAKITGRLGSAERQIATR